MDGQCERVSMNREYEIELARRLSFPQDAVTKLDAASWKIWERARADFDKLREDYICLDYQYQAVDKEVESLGASLSLSPYTVSMLLMLDLAKDAETSYAELDPSGRLFLDTFADLLYKLRECQYVKDTAGTFVAGWYSIFFTRHLFKLGRLEYEMIRYPFEKEYREERSGIVLHKGSAVVNVHIPSSGEPFDDAARLSSYRQAYDFFKKVYPEAFYNGCLAIVCHSWLLYPPYAAILPESSHIRAFQRDFAIVHEEEYPRFYDDWRVFGPYAGLSPEHLPGDTSMRRAFRSYMMAGGRHGAGFGVRLFEPG